MIRHTFQCKSNCLRDVFNNHYSIGSYQREYKWEEEQIAALVSDFKAAFEATDDKSLQSTYFLGPIVTQKGKDATRIVDGQQRLTTLTLIFIYLLNHKSVSDNRKQVIENLIYSFKGGEKVYAVDVPDRNGVFDRLISNSDDADFNEYLWKVDSRSCWNIVEAYEIVEGAFSEWSLSSEMLGKFVDWLSEDVFLIEIYADNNEMSSTIFETMNDRGMSLTNSELLKSYAISQFQTEKDIKEIDEIWRNNIEKLFKQRKSDAASYFFRAWLRAKYADTNSEYDSIGNKFHHWIRDNKIKLWGGDSLDNFRSFIVDEMGAFVDHYVLLHEASKPSYQSKHDDLNAVYYNKKTSFDLQYTCAIAPLTSTDSTATTKAKIELVSRALDIFVVRNMVNHENFGAANSKDRIHKLSKKIRRQPSVEKLQETLVGWLEEQEEDTGSILAIANYIPKKTPHARYLLARVTAWMEVEMGDEFANVQKYLSSSFQVEHILPNTFVENLPAYSDYDNYFDYNEWRGRLSAQLLINKSDNASLGANPYKEKLEVYYRNNRLASSLSKMAYKNNPPLVEFRKKHRLDDELGPFNTFGKEEIEARGRLLSKIAKKIWDPAKVLQV